MIEIYLKYDNMHTFRVINAFICINNYVNSCIDRMLSHTFVCFQLLHNFFLLNARMQISPIHLIEDEKLRFCHVASEVRSLCNVDDLDRVCFLSLLCVDFMQ